MGTPAKEAPAEPRYYTAKNGEKVALSPAFRGVKGKSGPPIGNRNGMRHGLTAGKLPLSCKYLENQINRLRRDLEDRVMTLKGEVSILDAANIQTVCKWERHGGLALRWLRIEAENLKPSDRLNFSREIAKASSERDKAIACLGLDAKPQSPWALDVDSIEVEDD